MATKIHITLVILLICMAPLCVAQYGSFSGLVLDSVGGFPLAGVHVDGGEHGDAITDNLGKFTLRSRSELGAELEFSLTGYHTKRQMVKWSEVDPAEHFVVYLSPRYEELSPVVIRSGPVVVYQRKDLHVGAYHANSDGLWVLVYDKPKLWHSTGQVGEQVFEGARMYLLDTLFNERSAVDLDGEVLALYHDRDHQPIIEGRTKAWYAHVDNTAITLHPIDKQILHDGILPWTDSVPGYLLGSNLSHTYPAFSHIAYDPERNEANAFCSVEDDFLVELLRSEYKYMSGADKVIAMNFETELGIDKEIIAGHMTRFYEHLYFKIPYAPLFRSNDTLCVFDKYKQAIRRYTLELEPAGEVPFSESYGREHWDLLLQDASTGKVYAQFSKGPITTLRAIDTTTGSFGKAFALGHPFPEEIQVNDGYVYFVYRTYGSLQRRTLYREALQ
ncbi:MAG: hypothetical protein KA408_09370 [Flavobacteriales bacterium]|nr:hypothetical protein [Flavobacteriales bacterium]